MNRQRAWSIPDQLDGLGDHSHSGATGCTGLMHRLFVTQRGARRLLRPTVAAGSFERSMLSVLRLEREASTHLHLSEVDEDLGGLQGFLG